MSVHIPANVTFGGAAYDPDEIVAWSEQNDQHVQTIEVPELDWSMYPAAPALEMATLRAELGVRPLSEIKADPPPPMLLDRIDPNGHTVLFGAGGAGKGTIASNWAIGCINSGLKVLIVDYENHPDEWARRVVGLGGEEAREGMFHVSPLSPAWTMKRGPLWEQARELRETAKAIKADVMIIDSIVMACVGVDPMKPETATAYAAALELIGLPVLSLAHVTKADDLRYPFGSVYWHNFARTTWSLKRDGERAILQHRKRNNYASLGRFVVTTTWRDDLPGEVWEQPYNVVLADRIDDALGDERLTVEQIIDRLNGDADDDSEPVKVDSVRKALRRGLRDPQRFTVDGERYSRAKP